MTFVKIVLLGRKRRRQIKTVVLLYDTSCIYEIVILNYFLKVTGKEMQFVSLDGKEITTTEGYRIAPEERLDQVDPKDVVTSDRITTSRANGYVDFAIEVAKQMELFEDEADLQETIAFWREFQRIESN